MSTQRKLPEFDKPPIIEAVLSVQFETPEEYRHIFARDVWANYEENFPQVQEMPELPPSFEIFGGMATAQPPHIEFLGAITPSRYWFVSKDNSELIQFQKNRFLHNWRSLGDQNNQYPRFEKIFSSFSKELETLESFYVSKKWGKLVVNQCEVTYINHIDLTDEMSKPIEVFSDLNLPFEKGVIDYSINHRRVFVSDDRKPLGRLYINAQTGANQQRKPILLLDLTAKGAPEKPDLASALKLIRRMREEIVTTFAETTSDQMHKIWGRKI